MLSLASRGGCSSTAVVVPRSSARVAKNKTWVEILTFDHWRCTIVHLRVKSIYRMWHGLWHCSELHKVYTVQYVPYRAPVFIMRRCRRMRLSAAGMLRLGVARCRKGRNRCGRCEGHACAVISRQILPSPRRAEKGDPDCHLISRSRAVRIRELALESLGTQLSGAPPVRLSRWQYHVHTCVRRVRCAESCPLPQVTTRRCIIPGIEIAVIRTSR